MHGVTDFSKEAKFRGSMPRHPSIGVSTEAFAIDFHILNLTALSVVGVLQYSLLPLAL
jgi:hypothetical protein